MESINDHNKNNLHNDGRKFDTDSNQNPTKQALLQHNNSVQDFVVLCHGLKSFTGSNISSIDSNSWRPMSKEIFKPKANLYKPELICCHVNFSISTPKPRTNNWTAVKMSTMVG